MEQISTMKNLRKLYRQGVLMLVIAALASVSCFQRLQDERLESRDMIPEVDEAKVSVKFWPTQWVDYSGARGARGPFRLAFEVSGDKGYHLRIIPKELSIKVEGGTTTVCDLSDIDWVFEPTGSSRADWMTGYTRSEEEVRIEYDRTELIDVPIDPEQEITMVFSGELVTTSGQQQFELNIPLVSYMYGPSSDQPRYNQFLRNLDPDPVIAGAKFDLGTVIPLVYRPGVEAEPRISNFPRVRVMGTKAQHHSLLVTSYQVTGPDGVAIELMEKPKEYKFFPTRPPGSLPPGMTEMPAGIDRVVKRELIFDVGDRLTMELKGTLKTADGPVEVSVKREFLIERIKMM